jgi:DDE superfamily endonuclease
MRVLRLSPPPPTTAAVILPPDAQPLLTLLLPHFTRPTAARFVLLAAAAILTPGRRTVANLLRTVGRLAPGHDASSRRVLSAARWSGLHLGCAVTRFLLAHLLPAGPVLLVGDDTVDGHPGRRVYGTRPHGGRRRR